MLQALEVMLVICDENDILIVVNNILRTTLQLPESLAGSACHDSYILSYSAAAIPAEE